MSIFIDTYRDVLHPELEAIFQNQQMALTLLWNTRDGGDITPLRLIFHNMIIYALPSARQELCLKIIIKKPNVFHKVLEEVASSSFFHRVWVSSNYIGCACVINNVNRALCSRIMEDSFRYGEKEYKRMPLRIIKDEVVSKKASSGEDPHHRKLISGRPFNT